MDSELVQRLQNQLLDLRTENCEFSERKRDFEVLQSLLLRRFCNFADFLDFADFAEFVILQNL